MLIALSVGWWALVAVHLAGCLRSDKLRRVTKPLLMPALLGIYLVVCPRPEVAIVIALVFAFAGDSLLLRNGARRMVLGGAAFLVCHVAYVTAFVTSTDWAAVPGWVWPAAALYAAAGLAVHRAVRTGLGATRLPAVAYLVALAATGLTALLRCAGGAPWGTVTWAGTVFFLISDTILVVSQYRRPVARADFYVMTTYCLAQYLIVTGLAGGAG